MEEDVQKLRETVLKLLDSYGYFSSDIVNSFEESPNWKNPEDKTFGELLMDFACLYNLEFENKKVSYKYG